MLAAAGAFIVSGCAEIPAYSNVVDAARFMVAGLPDPPIERATIAKLPYATITAKIGRGPRSLLVLGRYDGEDRHWLSADRAVLVTRGGRVVKTAGLPENLKDTQADATDPVDKRLHEIEEGTRFTRRVDFDVDRRFGLPIESTFETVGPRTVTIIEIEFDTVLVRERNVARTINWRFENLYWVDAIDGFVWKSRQHIARSFPPVEIEVLKPAT